MNIKELLNYCVDVLKKHKIQNPINIARRIICYNLNYSKEYIIMHDEKIVDNVAEKKCISDINKIIEHIPIQYIIHNQEFMKLNFYVDENVLIPRDDTEILVEEVIKISNKENKKILDLCTGSGAIAVSCSKYIKNAKVYASDVSKKALEVAKKNAILNDVCIEFIESDLFNKINERFDIIVSNPPYIEKDVIKTLDEIVKKEPIIALDGGRDGLDFYRKIINQAPKYLKKEGYLCLEIGFNQKEKVINILQDRENYKNIYSKKDLGGNDRIVIAQIIKEEV